MVSVTNSVTRNPVAYSNSNMALSRNSSGISTSGVFNKSVTCCSVKYLGKRLGNLGELSTALGSSVRYFSRYKYWNNFRIALNIRAVLVAL